MTHGLPQLLEEIAAVAGIDAAWALVRAHGGTRVYIPPQVSTDHWLVQLVGAEAARRLVEHFRDRTADHGFIGRRLDIPMASAEQGKAAWEKVLDATLGGKPLSLRETARVMGTTERTVSRRRRQRRQAHAERASDQDELF